MASLQSQAVQDQFTRTADAFALYARRDTPEVLAERIEFAELAPDQMMLDVACGPGAFVLAAAPRVRFARGLDVTAEMLLHARRFQQERGISNASFERGEAERLPYRSGLFDRVCCQFAFHHLTDPEAALAEMLRVAKFGGHLFLADSLASEDAAKSELRNRIERLRDPSHTTTLSTTALRALLTKHGLEVVKETIRDRTRSFHQWMRRAGAGPSDTNYQRIRRAIEDSIEGDRIGLSPRVSGDDLSIVHREGMFLAARKW